MAFTPEQRMQIASSMFDTARILVLSSFPPGLNEVETKRRFCERLYGNEIDVDAFIHAWLEWRKSDPSSASS